MRRVAVAILLAVFGLAGLWVIVRPSLNAVPTGEAAQFLLPDLEGKPVSLQKLRGKVVLLNVWATWCPPCVEEMPALEALHRRMSGEDFQIVAVSQDVDVARVGPWVRERGFTFPIVLDPGQQVSQSYGITGFPETFILDRNGIIVDHHIGFRDWSAQPVVDALERLRKTGEWVGIDDAPGRRVAPR